MLNRQILIFQYFLVQHQVRNRSPAPSLAPGPSQNFIWPTVTFFVADGQNLLKDILKSTR